MTLAEFSEVIHFLETSTGKPIAPTPTAALERTNIYYSFLGDLPIAVLRCVAEKVLLEPLYNQFPSIEALRRLAVAAMAGEEMGAAEAWKLAYRVACNVDPSNEASYWKDGQLWDSQCAYAMAKLPPIVAEAVRRFGGIKLMANSDAKFAREPFMRIVAELVATEQKHKILPEGLRRRIAAIGGDKGLPVVVAELAGKIGAG